MKDSGVDYSRYYIKNRHTSTDIASSDGSDNKCEKTTKKKGSRIGKIAYTCLIILIVISIVLVTIDTVKGGYVVSEIIRRIKGENDSGKCYYGVVVSTVEDMDSARLYASSIRQREGAGYVVFDEGYNILVSVYEREEDAMDVSKKLKLAGENTKIYVFRIENIDYLALPERLRDKAKLALGYHETLLTKLANVESDLALGNIDEHAGKARIRGIEDEMHNVVAEFSVDASKYMAKADVVKIKAELVSVEAMLTNLAGDVVERPNLLADIRYTECLIVNSYRELTRELKCQK